MSRAGWRRTDYHGAAATVASPDTSSICYYRVPRDCEDGTRSYILTFTHVFEYDKDVVYFASCFPYTYTGEE